jgi:hypothetical protein
MSNYFDKWGRLHHKPCINGEPSGNNGWLFSAYAKKAGISLNDTLLAECFRDCVRTHPDGQRYLVRSPDKELPPMSRDEILGLAYLGLLRKEHLNGWNFSPYPLPKFSLKTLLKQLWEFRPEMYRYGLKGNKKLNIEWKHRNYFWQNNLDQLYRLSFSVPLVDRHFLLTHAELDANIVARAFYWAIAKVDSLMPKASGIRWLKYGKSREEMEREFPLDHPLRSRE